MIQVSRKCSLCKKGERELIWSRPIPGEAFVIAVCPRCDSSELGGPLSQRKKPEGTEA